ncbi:MAG: lactoylglutathione lyase [Gammaproteobacteria bacterium]|jgi:lactoylglutathione lyase
MKPKYPVQTLSQHSLNITNAQRSLEFYCAQLGMTLVEEATYDGKHHLFLSYTDNEALDSQSAVLELVVDNDNPFDNALSNSGYWKIAISVADLDVAYKRLTQTECTISKPFEVPNVAYLCHCEDPDGYCVEFLQHRFIRNHVAQKTNEPFPLATKAAFSLITLKIKDPEASLAFYQSQLGLRLLSRQEVTGRRFTLYFLSADSEIPPTSDIDDIPLREWLWQRPYTLLELQHVHGTESLSEFKYQTDSSTGLRSVKFESSNRDNEPVRLFDPDGYAIEITN